MPKRYYYTDPLKAAWTHREFNIQLFWIDEFGNDQNLKQTHDVLNCVVDFNNDSGVNFDIDNKFYIHPDCHETLKPQEGDIGIYQGQICRYFEGKVGWLLLYGKSELGNNSEVQIIQRNGKAFFMPEVEEI